MGERAAFIAHYFAYEPRGRGLSDAACNGDPFCAAFFRAAKLKALYALKRVCCRNDPVIVGVKTVLHALRTENDRRSVLKRLRDGFLMPVPARAYDGVAAADIFRLREHPAADRTAV